MFQKGRHVFPNYLFWSENNYCPTSTFSSSIICWWNVVVCSPNWQPTTTGTEVCDLISPFNFDQIDSIGLSMELYWPSFSYVASELTKIFVKRLWHGALPTTRSAKIFPKQKNVCKYEVGEIKLCLPFSTHSLSRPLTQSLLFDT